MFIARLQKKYTLYMSSSIDATNTMMLQSTSHCLSFFWLCTSCMYLWTKRRPRTYVKFYINHNSEQDRRQKTDVSCPGQEIFLFSRASRRAQESLQLPIQCVTTALSSRIKCRGERNTRLCLVSRLRMRGAIIPCY